MKLSSINVILIVDFQDRSGYQGGARNQGSFGPAAMSRYMSGQNDSWQQRGGGYNQREGRGGYKKRNSYGGGGGYGGGIQLLILNNCTHFCCGLSFV